MKFKWTMTERDWENFMHDNEIENEESIGDGFYGNCYVGNLCADIHHTLDYTDWYAYINLYGLGIDDGYGETPFFKIPYTLLDYDFKVPVDCDTFEEFKECFEKNFEECINSNDVCRELGNMPLAEWK